MTNEELITKLVKENYNYKNNLEQIDILANQILANLYCIGGGLNDNIKKYTKEQMLDLIKISGISKEIVFKCAGGDDENTN